MFLFYFSFDRGCKRGKRPEKGVGGGGGRRSLFNLALTVTCGGMKGHTFKLPKMIVVSPNEVVS